MNQGPKSVCLCALRGSMPNDNKDWPWPDKFCWSILGIGVVILLLLASKALLTIGHLAPLHSVFRIHHLEPWVTVISHVISYNSDIICDIGYIIGCRQTVISHLNYDGLTQRILFFQEPVTLTPTWMRFMERTHDEPDLLQIDRRSIANYDDAMNLMRYNNHFMYIKNLQQIRHCYKCK